MLIRTMRLTGGFVLLLMLFNSCVSNLAYTPLLKAEPEIDSAETRVPRTLRLYYDALPDVERSTVNLIGPAGEHTLRGLHTMAADDLMMEIIDPLTPGQYTVEWTTVVGDDPEVHTGAFNFIIL
jgi:methionine-rich copper-binding protein CopC